jgi:hypothetical protein
MTFLQKKLELVQAFFEAVRKCRTWAMSFKVLKVHILTRWRR